MEFVEEVNARRENNLGAAHRLKNKQDKAHPLLININDGRLVPNVQLIREGKSGRNYRPYGGDPKAPLEERMRMLSTDASGARRVVDSSMSSNSAPFDIGTAKPAELIDFARSQYGHEFAPGTHHNAMRAKLRELAAAANDLT